MEEGLIRPPEDGDSLNLEIDRLFHDLTGKEEYNVARIRMLEAELEKRQKEAESEREGFRKALELRNADMAKLEAEKARLETKLDETVSHYKARIDEERQEARAVHERLTGDSAAKTDRFADEIGALKEALGARDAEAEKLERELKVASDSYQSARAARDASQAELAGLRRIQDEYDDLKLFLENKNADIARLESEKGKLKAVLSEKISQFKMQLEAEKQAAHAGQRKLTDEIDSLKAALCARDMAIESLKGELKDARTTLGADVARMETDLAEKSAQFKAQLEGEKEAARSAQAELAEDFSVTEKGLLQETKGLKGELLARNGEIEKLRVEAEETRSRLSQALEQCAEEQNKVKEKDVFAQSARFALKDKEQEIARIWHILEETKAELAREKARLAVKDSTIENLQKAKQGLELDLSELSGSMAQREQDFYGKSESLKKELEAKERRNGELERRLETAEKKLGEALAEASGREKELEGTRSRLLEYEEKSGKLEREVQILASQAQKGGAEQRLARLLEAKEEVNKNLTQKIKSMEEAIASVHDEYSGRLKAAEEDKNMVVIDLKRREEEASAAMERQRALEAELADTAEKWRLAAAQLNNAVANLRERNSEIEILNGQVASLEHERENYKKLSEQARVAAAELSALAEKSESGQVAKLLETLKGESAKYGELLKKYEDLNLKHGRLEAEKTQAMTEADRLAAENKALSLETGQKAGGLLEARNGTIRELTQQIKGLEEVLAAERGRNAGLLEASADAKNRVLTEMKRKEEEASAAGERQRAVEKELAGLADKWQAAAAQLDDAAAELRKRDGEIKLLNGRVASLEQERENYKKISLQARTTAAELSALAEKSESEQVAKLFGTLKDETARYADLRKKYDDIKLTCGQLDAEKAQALAEAERITRENKALRAGAGRKAAGLLEAREETIREMAQQMKDLQEALAEERDRNAGLLQASADEKNGVLADLKRRADETSAARERQHALEIELGDTAEKWRLAAAQLNNAVANLRERDSEIEILNGRIASLDHERENYMKLAAQARTAAAELSALAEKNENEQVVKLLETLKGEAAKYGDLLQKFEDINVTCGLLDAERTQALAETERLARENKALSSGAERKAGGLLEAKNGMIRELTQRIKSLEDDLALERGRNAGFFRSAEDEKNGVLLDLKRREEEVFASRERQRALEAELADTEEQRRLAEAALNDAAADLRKRENDAKLLAGRVASLEHERENYKKILAQTRNAAAELSAIAEKGENEQIAGLFKTLKEESARHAELLVRYEDLRLKCGLLEAEKTQALSEAERLAVDNRALKERSETAAGAGRKELRELQEKLRSAEGAFRDEIAKAGAAEKARYEALAMEIRRVAAQLKQKEQELEKGRKESAPLKAECEALLESRKQLREKYSRELKAEDSVFEEAGKNIREHDALIAGLSASAAEARREAEKIRADKERLAASLKGKKGMQEKALRKALAEAEKALEDRERRLKRATGGLEKAEKEKNRLVEKERGLRASLDSRPYRSKLRAAEQKLALKEAALRSLQSRMDRAAAELETLKREDSQLAARSTELGADLTELLAGISHQVSNSISVIRSHAEFCLETPDSEDVKESLEVIVRNIVQLQKKIEDMLGFSRPVRLQLTETSLKAAAAEALGNIREEKDMSGITADISEQEGLKPLMADRVRLVAALEQVIRNAVEAMPAGGSIRVSVKAAPEGAQLLEVADSGQGIEAKHISMVFHPFFTTKPGKLGLGLALVKNIVKAHGGTVTVFSQAKKGATVAIVIPENVK